LIFNICFWLTTINASKLAQKYLGNKPAGNLLRIIFTAVFVVTFILSVSYFVPFLVRQFNWDKALTNK
jgi:hypothetical protein